MIKQQKQGVGLLGFDELYERYNRGEEGLTSHAFFALHRDSLALEYVLKADSRDLIKKICSCVANLSFIDKRIRMISSRHYEDQNEKILVAKQLLSLQDDRVKMQFMIITFLSLAYKYKEHYKQIPDIKCYDQKAQDYFNDFCKNRFGELPDSIQSSYLIACDLLSLKENLQNNTPFNDVAFPHLHAFFKKEIQHRQHSFVYDFRRANHQNFPEELCKKLQDSSQAWVDESPEMDFTAGFSM